MKTQTKADGAPKLEIIPHRRGGYYVGIKDENGLWPFKSIIFDTRVEAEKELSELNAPLKYESLCPDCKAGFTKQVFLKLNTVSGLWACPCSQNSLLFPSSETVSESVKKIQKFMASR